MALASGTTVGDFDTQVLLTAGGGTASVASTSFSVVGDSATETNADNAELMGVVFTGTFASAPGANKFIKLYVIPLNIDGTADQPFPSSDFQHACVGAIPVANSASAHSVQIIIPLPNGKGGQEYNFAIENKSGQSLNAGWTLKGTYKGIRQKA